MSSNPLTMFGTRALPDPLESSVAVNDRDQLLADFKWPMIAAGVTLLLILLWSLWPATAPSKDSFEMVNEIDPAVAPELILDAKSAAAMNSTTLIAARHVVVKGIVRLRNDRILVADEISFEPGSGIVVPSGRLTIIAPRITRAAIDVSGHPGLDGLKAGAAGGNGETGGIVLVAGATFEDSKVVAMGGDGGDGARGYTGAPGRNGFCGPHGFGIAQRGATGGAGGKAGSGGGGGVIMVLYAASPAKSNAAEGAFGVPGRGGSGGRGGAGCKGLRGNQPNQPPGNEGAAGLDGSRGGEGSVDIRHIEFDAVIDAFNDWLDGDEHSPEQLRDRLLAIRQLVAS